MQCRYSQIQNDAASIYVCVILYKIPCKHVICVYVCVGVYSDFETSTLYGCLICKNVLRDA